MIEPWMMLDCEGNPIPATLLDQFEQRVIGLDEYQRLAEGSRYLSEILDKYENGDIILWHTSSAEAWDRLMGSEGYALIRGQYFVHSIVTKMN